MVTALALVGGFSGHSGRRVYGWMSLLDEEVYGKQTRVLKVCLHHLLSSFYFFFPSLPLFPLASFHPFCTLYYF